MLQFLLRKGWVHWNATSIGIDNLPLCLRRFLFCLYDRIVFINSSLILVNLFLLAVNLFLLGVNSFLLAVNSFFLVVYFVFQHIQGDVETGHQECKCADG